MKKLFSLILVLSLLLSGCGGAAPVETAPAQTTAPETTEATPTEPVLGSQPVNLTFWHSASDEAGVLMDKYISDFNASNPYGITVKGIYQGQYADATTLLKTLLSAENYSELPDVMQMDATGKMTYVHSGKAFTTQDALAAYPQPGFLEDYLPTALTNWQFAGTQLGLPFATSTTVTYYNADLLSAAGWDKAPDTFADISALYADLTAAGRTEKVLQTIPNSPTLANWLGQLGSYLVNNRNGADGVATALDCVDSGALETFLTAWKAMYDNGALLNEGSSSDLFISGGVAVMTGSSSNVHSILTKVDGAFEVGVAPYLRVNEDAAYGAGVSGSCVVMFDSGDSLRKAAAWEFVKYLTSAEVQADFAAGTGYVPAHKGAMDTAVYQDLIAQYPQYAVAYQQLMDTPETITSVTVGPAKDFYYAVMQGVSDMLEYDQTPAEAAEILEDELTMLLEDYLRSNS